MRDIVLTENIKLTLVRSVSKNGDFFLAKNELEILSGNLSAQEVVDLYEHIRDKSQRLEEEWRDEFIDAFPDQADLLPARTS